MKYSRKNIKIIIIFSDFLLVNIKFVLLYENN